MSLIKCYKCEKYISDKAGQCPKCGAPVLGISSNDNRAMPNSEPAPTDERTFLNGQSDQTAHNRQLSSQSTNVVPPAPKKSNKGLIFALSAILFALIVVLAIAIIRKKQDEQDAERQMAKVEAQSKQLEKEKREIEAKQTELEEEQRKIEEARRQEAAEKARQLAAVRKAEAEAAAAERRANERRKLESFNGSYYYNGTVRNNLHSHAEYPFTISFSIDDGSVDGTFETESNSGPLRGSIDANGNMKLSEYNYDGTPTGYYFKGKFNGNKYKVHIALLQENAICHSGLSEFNNMFFVSLV